MTGKSRLPNIKRQIQDNRQKLDTNLALNLEKKLLNLIAEASYDSKPFLVSDVIFSSSIGSPATLSRRLNSLAKKNVIVYMNGDDGRKKFLELTSKSKKYFTELEKLILLAGKMSRD